MLRTLLLYYSSFHAAVCRIMFVGALPYDNILISRRNLMIQNKILLYLSLSLLVSCDIEDERDICCDRIIMEYHYIRDGQDLFKENIYSLRHFLFDQKGHFIEEVPAANGLQYQELKKMATGPYTMVTVGNSAEGTILETPLANSRLQNFMLHIAGTDGRNADPLYYGICRFNLLRESANREQRFVTQMSNVHCKLKVTVKWQNRPPLLTQEPIYRLTLNHAPESYELDALNGYAMGEKQFPYSPAWNREHGIDCSLNSRQLNGTFTSLRYTNNNLPILNVLCLKEGKYVEQTPPLDLKVAFSAWGYRPSSAERQDYKIVVTIYLDGHVGVKVEMESGIADWVDGGSFG